MSATMKVSHQFDTSVEKLAQLLADPDFLKAKYAAIGASDVTITSVEDRDGNPRIVSSRKVTVDLPSFAKKVMQPTNTVVQTDDWQVVGDDGSRVCNYTVEVKGVPSRIDGTVKLSPAGEGVSQDIVAQVKVSIPLLGGRLEKFAVSSGVDQLRAEAEFTAKHLAGT